jgi:ABC-type phosphate transport system substrate-binding protein
MFKITRKSRVVKVAAATAAIGSLAAIGFAGSSPTQAEPKQFTGINVFGSDTLQEVTNAFAGFADGKAYIPLFAGTNQRVITNWDTLPDNQCMSTKSGSPSFHRPNGSSEGRYMLGIAAGGGTYQSTFCGNANVSGVIDVARTSSFVSSTAGPLVYVPLGRDATGFAYYAKAGVTPVTSLTRAQLITIYTSGSLTVGTTRIIPCGIQLGSGTYASWNTALGVASTEIAAQAECAAIATTTDDNDGRLQESKAPPLVDKGEGAPANTQVIVGFSAANFIAQMNNVAPSPAGGPIALGVDLGSLTSGAGVALGKPYTVSGTTYTPSAPVYNDGNFGRTIGYVLPEATVDQPGELAIKDMFINQGTDLADICEPAAQTTTNLFGFLSIATCGTTNLRGPYLTSSANFPIPLS